MMTAEERAAGYKMAETIIAQMGGHRMLAMVGGFASYSMEEGLVTLSIRFMAKARRRINHVEVHLNCADMYDVEFWHINARSAKWNKIERIEDVFADQLRGLFQEITGLATSL